MSNKTHEQLNEMGQRILDVTRTELYLSMRFMGAALNSLDFKMDLSTRTVGTDAVSVRFNPTYLMQMYLERPELMNRMYMHMLMHCIFRHMFSAKEHEDSELWDLCCDIAAESVVDSMDYPSIRRVSSDLREEWYEKLRKEVHVLTAEKLYHYLIFGKRDPYIEESLRQEFSMCDHGFWERMRTDEEEKDHGGKAGMEQNQGNSQDISGEREAAPAGSGNPKEEEWKDHARRIQSEMEAYAKASAEDAGSLKWLLAVENRERTSYKEYLKRFAVVREESRMDPDSFDYGYYMYGLAMYDNMPLVEENEFCECKKVETLVIAIDTSASCRAGLVQQFLNETAAILRSQETFFHRIDVHIIECDNQVQKDIAISHVDELEKYSAGFEVRGGYGTDFRPVFAYVEKLQGQGQLVNLRGLMYFTDGFGIYPETPSPYDTAFVFWQEEEFEDVKVPDWALKLYLK